MTLLLSVSENIFAMDACPEGTIARKVPLMWADKGLLQTFDCMREGRREYILLLNDQGHAEANAMIHDSNGGSTPQIMQYQRYDTQGVLRESKKFSSNGAINRIEHFSESGMMILRFVSESNKLEEFSNAKAGEKLRECKLDAEGRVIDTTRDLELSIEIIEKDVDGIRQVEIFEIIFSNGEIEKKLLFKSRILELLENQQPGQVKIVVQGIESCFVSLAEKSIYGAFLMGSKQLHIPEMFPFAISKLLTLLKAPRSEETKRFIELYGGN